MKIKTLVAAIALTGMTQVSFADVEKERSAAGGFIVGAIAGGPAGAFAGALFGGEVVGRLFKHKRVEGELQFEISRLETDLVSERERHNLEIASLNSDLDKLIAIQSNTIKSRALPVQFRTASSDLEGQYMHEVRQLARVLKRNQDANITLTGFSDRRGDEAYNLLLSKERVDTLYDFLISEGVKANQIKTIAHGETQPIDAVESLDGNFFDRRVMVELHLDVDPQLATR